MPSPDALDDLIAQVLERFEIYRPPVPVEMMLSRPLEDLWDPVDPTQMSGILFSMRQRYAPRMSSARLLARHICGSPWGEARGLSEILLNVDAVNAFARALIMPRDFVQQMASAGRNPTTISIAFEVPEEDARLRLLDLV